MSLGTVLLIILILLLLGALPTWPYSTGWGYYPSSGLGCRAPLCDPPAHRQNLAWRSDVLRSRQLGSLITSSPPAAIAWRWSSR
jgi:Protein of unknown function (DUF3309)